MTNIDLILAFMYSTGFLLFSLATLGVVNVEMPIKSKILFLLLTLLFPIAGPAITLGTLIVTTSRNRKHLPHESFTETEQLQHVAARLEAQRKSNAALQSRQATASTGEIDAHPAPLLREEHHCIPQLQPHLHGTVRQVTAYSADPSSHRAPEYRQHGIAT